MGIVGGSMFAGSECEAKTALVGVEAAVEAAGGECIEVAGYSYRCI
jgi:hypothetical protein